MRLSVKDNYKRIIFDAVILGYFFVVWFLYYNQLLYPTTGLFESDTSVHVRFAVEEGYYHSLAAFIYLGLSFLPFCNLWISLVLALATAGAIVATKVLLEKIYSYYGEKANESFLYSFAVISNIVMAFYVKAANRQHYIGYESPNMWHNSTYIFMRFFAVLTVISFFEIFESYKEKIELSKWVKFTVLLSVTTGFKASFLTVFAPLLAVMLVIDLCKKTKFKNVFLMGISVFPSLFIMYIQSRVMAGDGESNGYIISPFTALSLRGDHPKATLVLSVFFPLLVFLFSIKHFYKDKLYFGSLIMSGIAFLEVFLLAERGERELDGNFMWGYFIALFFLYMISMVKMVRNRNELIPRNRFLANAVFAVLCVVLAWHALSGIWYLGLLLTGVTYFV